MNGRIRIDESHVGKYIIFKHGFAKDLIGIIEKSDKEKFPDGLDFIGVTRGSMRQGILTTDDVTFIEIDDYPKYNLDYPTDWMANQLMTYENGAYEERFGIDWLTDIGENVRIYLEGCAEDNSTPTINGLFDHIRELHKRTME